MEVRDRILEAALELLSKSGAHELTQPKVAKAAGVRQSHLTYYFPTRGDLLQEVARYSIAALAGQLAHAKVHNPSQVAHGIAADRDPKIRQRLRKFIDELRSMMTPALAQSGLETDPDSVAFFHSVVVGCAVLQLARDNAQARAEAQAVIKKAAGYLARERR